MNNSLRNKLVIISLTSIFLVSFLAVHPTTAFYPSETWPAQANGCVPYNNIINGTLDYVYLGLGTTIPSNISSQYPNASATYIDAWKEAIVGMRVNQFKSFIIPKSLGYTIPTNSLYDKDLFFETTILTIYNVGSTGLTTQNSVVKVKYTLYTGCKVLSSYPQAGTPTSTSTVAAVPKSSPPNYTGIIVGAVLVGVVVLAAVGYVVLKGRKTNVNTDKIINETRRKETQNIQSLKESLLPNQNNLPKPSTKKQSTTRRRR